MFRAWTVWLLSALFMCYKYAIEVSPSVMTTNLMSEFSLSGTQMGNLAASYFYAYLLLQIPAGLLIDRWGPRRVTTSAIILCSLGVLLFSFSESFWTACLGRFITGVGAAFAAINCLKLIANWFPARQFALMAGLMMTVGMLGAVGGQAPLAEFISYLGWRESMYVLALGGVALAVLFVLTIQDKAPHSSTVEAPSHRPGVVKNLTQIFRNGQSWYLSLYSALAFAPVSAFGGLWGVPFLTEAYGVSSKIAASGTSLIFLGFACGAPFFGWLSDRLGKRRPVMFWGTLVATLLLAAILYLPDLLGFLVFPYLFLFGFSIASFLLCFTMIKEMHLVSLAATSVGFMNAFDALFGAFSDPLTGKILDAGWTGKMIDGARAFSLSDYQFSLSLLIVYFALSLVFLKMTRETQCKQALSNP